MRTAELLERVQAAYSEYAFHKVYRGVYDFATVDLSAFYFDILKDRLYTAPAGSVAAEGRADHSLSDCRRPGARRGAAAVLHRGRSLDAPSRSAVAGKERSPGQVCFPRGPARGTLRSSTCSGWKTGRA